MILLCKIKSAKPLQSSWCTVHCLIIQFSWKPIIIGIFNNNKNICTDEL